MEVQGYFVGHFSVDARVHHAVQFLGRLLVSVCLVLAQEEAEAALSTADDGRRRRGPLAHAATSLSTDDDVVMVSAVAGVATTAPLPAPAALAAPATVAGKSPGLTSRRPFPSAEMAGGGHPCFRRLRPMSDVARTASGVAADGSAGGATSSARPPTPSTLMDTPKSGAPVPSVPVAATVAETTNTGSGPNAVITTGMTPSGRPTGTGIGSRSAAVADAAADPGGAVAGEVPRNVGIGRPATAAARTALNKNRGLSSGIEKLSVPRPLLCFVL